jgi:hypothetical protein
MFVQPAFLSNTVLWEKKRSQNWAADGIYVYMEKAKADEKSQEG